MASPQPVPSSKGIRSRSCFDGGSARARAPREAGADGNRRALAGAHRRDRRCDGGGGRSAVRGAGEARGRGDRLRRRRRQGPEESVLGRSRLPIHPADADRRRAAAPRRSEGRRDCRAVRRGCGDRAVDQSDLDRHLQDPHLAEGAMRHRHQPASIRRALHHARRRDHERSRARRRRARGQHQLDDDRHARRHAGADEEPRRRGDSRDGRHGPGARGVQLRQAGLRRRARATRRVTSKARPTSGRRRPTSSSARRSTTDCSARRRIRWWSIRPSRRS